MVLALLPAAVTRRRLAEVSRRLARCRQDLQVAEEQLEHLGDAEADAQLRALVSETPLAEGEYRRAARHAAAMAGHCDRVRAEIAELSERLDLLLDRLGSRRSP